MAPATVISHVFNEAYLLPFWLEHHRTIFSHGIIIDYASTDGSMDIVRRLCPTWDIRASANAYFDAVLVDREVMEIEESVTTGFKIALNTTEFFVLHSDAPMPPPDGNTCLEVPCIIPFADNPSAQMPRSLADLFSGICLAAQTPHTRTPRYMHSYPNGAYTTGRHGTHHQYSRATDACIVWMGFYPWNSRFVHRKLQIQYRMPESDKIIGYGFHHLWTFQQMAAEAAALLKNTMTLPDALRLRFLDIRGATTWRDHARIAIIGSAGHIGSYLYTFLKAEGLQCTGYSTRASAFTDVITAGRDIPETTLRTHDVVIYLAGISGAEACDAHGWGRVRAENVDDICAVAGRLSASQQLLYASSACIVEGHMSSCQAEDAVVQEESLAPHPRSMLERERALAAIGLAVPTIGLRFGTVAGALPTQRTKDTMFIAMVRSALETGYVNVSNKDCHRAILGLRDLAGAVFEVVRRSCLGEAPRPAPHRIYNLASFNTTIGEVAASVASATHAKLRDNKTTTPATSFALDMTRFNSDFPDVIMSATNESLAKELAESVSKGTSPCRVCKGPNCRAIIDIGPQALANNYVETPCEQPTFPLVLTRCPDCYHTQLDSTVSPDIMFSTYQYNSGVSQTIREYFSWLADVVIAEAPPGASTILELACNDGSQLDEFARRGWKTYGVDPAHNIVQTALAKGHSVSIAFWGFEDVVDPTMPTPDAIIAQNVLAHVPDPVIFLKSCQSVMGAASRLYIQTSQCNMYENGEFDTIYHEHLSYFTAASMARAAMEAGLRIVNARKTPIHGTSFLFTMMRNDDPTIHDPDPSLTAILDHERSLGVYSKGYFTRFKRRAHDIRDWVNIALADYKGQGYGIVAFGAAAKGMTALSFFSPHEQIDYIVDDAKMKQGRYTPATNIIIKHPDVLREDTRNLAIIILAWNFATEISQKIRQLRSSVSARTAIICCFPNQTIETILPAD